MAVWEWIKEAFFWFLEGLLGCLQAAQRVHSDVPTLQCLASGLIVAGFGFGMGFLGDRIRQKRKERKRRNQYED